jgi:hypothetical protein
MAASFIVCVYRLWKVEARKDLCVAIAQKKWRCTTSVNGIARHTIQTPGRTLRSTVLTDVSLGTASGTRLSTIAEKLHLGTLKAVVSCCLRIEGKDEAVPSYTHAAAYLYHPVD